MLLSAVLNCSRAPDCPLRSPPWKQLFSCASPAPVSRQASMPTAVSAQAGHLVPCSAHLTYTISISFHEDFTITAVKGCGILLPPAACILVLNSVGGATACRAISGRDRWFRPRG